MGLIATVFSPSKFTTKYGATAVCLFALTACGSSGDGRVVSFPAAPGAGAGSIAAADVAGLPTDFEAFANGVADGSIVQTDPASLPSAATLTGYLVNEGGNPDEAVVGNLTLTADFSGSTIAAEASDFAEFDFTDPANPVPVSTLGIIGGSLSGSGTITGNEFTSTLDGTVTTTAGNDIVDADLSGGFLNNGPVLTAVGGVSGTVNGNPISGGVFYAE